MSELRQKLKIILGLVFGGLLVGGITLLVALQSGEKTRQRIKTNAASAYDHIKGRSIEFIEGMRGKASQLAFGVSKDAQRVLPPKFAERMVFKQ